MNDIAAFPKTGAFHPDAPKEYDSVDTAGMTLRDYFACAAMTTLVAVSDCEEAIATKAYRIADKMLEARVL